MGESRYGGSITTFTGRTFYPLDPRADEVEIEDIAQGLSLKCRWTGQCSRFYSVAFHSIRVARVAKFLGEMDHLPPAALESIFTIGLLHDAHEAYLPDIAGPIKKFISGWSAYEEAVQQAIYDRFGIDPMVAQSVYSYVKWADLMLLVIENEELFKTPVGAEQLFNNYDVRKLWPTFPVVPSAVRAVAKAFPYETAHSEIIEHLGTLVPVAGR